VRIAAERRRRAAVGRPHEQEQRSGSVGSESQTEEEISDLCGMF
jgi:hypothetical protein